ncbi:guanine nucleotide-binding protein subunit alpha, partial [Ascosphaera pollenicola]
MCYKTPPQQLKAQPYLSARQFAFCAGSTTVLAEIDDDLNVSQRFFRARTSVAHHAHAAPSSHVALAGAHNRPRAHSGSSRTTPLRNGSFGAGDGASAAMSARERVKSVTSVALSANGRWIAAGETGYSPRVLIFSTAPDSFSSYNDAAAAASPLAVLTEHSFGVKSIAFSPDSQYLATLGDINDGFLHVWALTSKSGAAAAKLHSTNKCTSVVRGMCFVGNNVLTVGVRHIKAWRVEVSSPTRSKFSDGASVGSPSPLTGRNCVLGSFGDSTFSCVASVSENEAVVCTESGAICLYDDKNGHQKLQFVQNVGFGILSVAYDAATCRNFNL